MSNYSRSWTACAVIISSFIHSKAVVTRVKSLENDRQGRSRREYSVPETAVWPKMFHVNRARRNSPRFLLYLARLFKFRPRPHLSRVHSTPVLSPQFLCRMVFFSAAILGDEIEGLPVRGGPLTPLSLARPQAWRQSRAIARSHDILRPDVHWELCLCAASPARTSRGPAGGCRTLATNTDRPLTNPPHRPRVASHPRP